MTRILEPPVTPARGGLEVGLELQMKVTVMHIIKASLPILIGFAAFQSNAEPLGVKVGLWQASTYLVNSHWSPSGPEAPNWKDITPSVKKFCFTEKNLAIGAFSEHTKKFYADNSCIIEGKAETSRFISATVWCPTPKAGAAYSINTLAFVAN